MKSKLFFLSTLCVSLSACNVATVQTLTPGALGGTPDPTLGTDPGSTNPPMVSVDGLQLSGESVSNTEIDLSWNNSRGGVSRFRLERKSKGGTDAFLVLPTTSAMSYADTGLNGSAGYTYRLTALDGQGQSVGASLSVTVLVGQALSATAQTDGIHLSLPPDCGTLTWTVTEDTGAAIANPPANGTQSIPIAANQTTYLDQSVPSEWEVAYVCSRNPAKTVLIRANANQNIPTGTPSPPSSPPTTPPAQNQAVHDGGGQELTTSMITSNSLYKNYVIHKAELYVLSVSNVTITNCDIGGNGAWKEGAIFLNNINGVSISGNNFHDMPTQYAIVAYDTTIVNSHFDNNVFNNVHEPIHLGLGNGGSSHDDTANNNYINAYSNCGIEIQSVSVSGLKVLNNYVANSTNPHGGIGLSIATGDGSTIPGAKTSGNEIGYNIVLGTPAMMGSGAIENYGSGTNVHDNYIRQWNWGLMWNWTGLKGNIPWNMSNNVIIGCNSADSAEGFGNQAQNIPPTRNGNQIFSLNDPKAPPVPKWSATRALP